MSKRLISEAVAGDILELILGFRGFTKVATPADWAEYNKYKEELTVIIQNRLEKEMASSYCSCGHTKEAHHTEGRCHGLVEKKDNTRQVCRCTAFIRHEVISES